MGLVATWLNGCGLAHAVPNFTAAGIVTPAALAELDLAHYEALGVKTAEDRRKLFYLVQRIKLAVDKEKQQSSKVENSSTVEDQVEKMVASTSDAAEQAHGESTDGSSPLKKTKPAISPASRRNPSKIQQPKARSPTSKLAYSKTSGTSPGETTSPVSNTNTTASPGDNRTSQMEDSSSTWHDEEDDDVADDEASEVLNSVRRSKRIATKGKIATTSRTATTTKPTTNTSRTGTAGYKTPLTKSKSATNVSNQKQQQVNKNSKPGTTFPRSARPDSRLQNPSKSLRTGKQLSAIPSDSIAAMSPLPAAKLDELPEEPKRAAKQDLSSRLGKKNGSNNSSGSKGRSRHSLSGSISDSSDTESKGSRTTKSKSRSRRSLDGSRIGRSSGSYDSDSSTNSSRRRSSITTPKATTGRTNGVGVEKSSTTKRGNAPQPKGNKTNKSSGSTMVIHGNNDADDTSWKAQIAARRQEVDSEHELFSTDDIFYDDDEDDMQIRVAIRKRPFNPEKPSDVDVLHPLEYGPYGKILAFQPKTRVDLTKEIETVPFAFDTVFGDQYNNMDIYNKAVRNLIPVVLDGEHATVFAFGCTGSGKTFTLMGSGHTSSRVVEERNMGLYYMAALDIFRSLEEFEEFSHLSVSVSLFEIYGGKLYDLLHDRKPVKCLEDHKGKVQFPGLSEHAIEGPGDLMDMIEVGASARSTGSTSRNADSSRSHAVIQLHLRKHVGRKQNVEHGRLTFIDLAGSERGADTANCSRATRLEGAEINQSLLALKEVIRARARGGSMNHVPFRGSKLTQVLKESFTGEKSRCLMIACVSGEQDTCEQTLNTLRYADRVKERNPETGALPAKLVKKGGRRTRSSIYKSSASMSSIVSASDQSYDTRTKKIGVTHKADAAQASWGDESSYNTKSTSVKESEAEAGQLVETPTRASIRSESFDDALLDAALNEDDPETLLASALSDESPEALLSGTLSEDSRPVSDSESAQANSLVDELIETHQSFLSAVLGMVQDEIILLENLKVDRDGFDNHKNQLEGMQQNQSSLISDLRACFETYTSIQEKFPDFQLKTHGEVLTALLGILKEQMALTDTLNVGSSGFDESIGKLDVLLQDKLLQISELSECFQSGNNTSSVGAAPCKLTSSPETLLEGESFRVGNEDGNMSDGSFEDLRV